MTFDELMVEDRIAAVARVQNGRLAMIEEAQSGDRGMLRGTLATAFVGLGAWLDRGAVERAAVARRRRADTQVRPYGVARWGGRS